MKSELLNQREHDLVRYQRQELYQANLITENEYADLAKDHAAVRRLEDYDVLRAKLSASEAENKRLTDALKESQASAELAVRRVTEENERLRDALESALDRVRGISGTLSQSQKGYVAACDNIINNLTRALSGSPEPAPHVENATGKPKVACIKCGDTGWLTGPGHDGEACECNQINPPCKTCGGTKLVQRGAFLSPCPDCCTSGGKG